MSPRRVRFSNGATNLLSVRLYTAQYGDLFAPNPKITLFGPRSCSINHQAPGCPLYSVSICGAISRYFFGKRSCHRFNGSLTCESASSKMLSAITFSSAFYELNEKGLRLRSRLAQTIHRTWKNITHCKPRSKRRSERAHELKGPLTCLVLGYKLALLRPITLHHFDMQSSSRYRPIARDRRGLLLDACAP